MALRNFQHLIRLLMCLCTFRCLELESVTFRLLATDRNAIVLQSWCRKRLGAHSQQELHKCPECEKTFRWSSGLWKHKSMVHRRRFPYVCSLCGHGVELLHQLRSHLASKHNMPKDYKCHVCEREFCHKGVFKEHMSTRHSINIYETLLPESF